MPSAQVYSSEPRLTSCKSELTLNNLDSPLAARVTALADLDDIVPHPPVYAVERPDIAPPVDHLLLQVGRAVVVARDARHLGEVVDDVTIVVSRVADATLLFTPFAIHAFLPAEP